MILFFKPREIIEFLKENKEENKKLEEKLGIGFVSTITSSYDKTFFEKFSTRGDFISYLYDVYCYIKYVDESFNPEIKADVYNDNKNCTFLGKTCQITPEIVANFFYQKEDLIETYKNVNQNTLELPENNTSIALKGDVSIDEAEEQKTLVENEIEKLKQEQEKQLELLKQEFKLKESQLKQQMAEKMASTVKDLCDSKDKIAKMERYLYRYLSYNGYSFKLEQIAKGDDAPKDAKLVIFQKIRYLDEELPKLASYDKIISSVNFEDFSNFEKILADNYVVRDYFLPSKKCCVAFQLSKNKTKTVGSFSYQAEVMSNPKNQKDVRTWIHYVESSYEIANWNKLGIYFRNGENIYIAWLDEDKITIQGDSLFLSNADFNKRENKFETSFRQLQDLSSTKEEDKGDVMLNNLKTVEYNYDEKIKLEDKFSARLYVLDIIQGIIDNQPEILGMPLEQNVAKALMEKSYKDIIFNNADNYIQNIKWKNFEEIYKEFAPKEICLNEPIYVCVNDDGKDRGRIGSSQRRTDFASINRGITKINLIQYEDNYYFYRRLNKEDFIKIPENEIEMSLKGLNFYLISNELLTDYNTILQSSWRLKLVQYLKNGKKHELSMITYRTKPNENKKHPWEDDMVDVMAFAIDNFDETDYFQIEFSLYSLKTTKKQEEPLESRIVKKKKSQWSSELEEIEQNKVHEELINYFSRELQHGFKEDLSKRKRNIYYYVEGGHFGQANVRIYKDEFFSIKNMTNEHIAYMINNKIKLPRLSETESLNALLNIKINLEESNKKKKKKE